MLSENAQRLLRQRYFINEEDNWEKLVTRLVNRVFPDKDTEFKALYFNDIYNTVWLPNSPALANCGKEKFGALACFVAGPTEDTLEDHLFHLGQIALVAKNGGGCGFTGTFIRPENSPVAGSAHGYSYGPNKWARSVSEYMNMMTQSGFRKMALMYTLSSDHPDLEKFINLKQTSNEKDLYNFNQSVFATDKFMQTAINDLDSNEHRLLVKLAENAWNNGEPGLLFDGTINNNTPYRASGQKISCTNPCGEQPLPAFGACCLGSINLASDVFATELDAFDFKKLKEIVRRITRFLDALGTANNFPSEYFRQWYKENRPIGIGVMGFADLLLRLKIRYGNEESCHLLARIMEVIRDESYSESQKLGKELGISNTNKKLKRRNVTTVSIAPTGSIAFIAGCSHGIEPIFSPEYTRTDERGETYKVIHPLANEPYFVAAIDTENIPTWEEHIDIQAAAQLYVDSGVSKTINMEETATVQDVYDAFIYAYYIGCKGLTVYRNNSRQVQVLNSDKAEEKNLDEDIKLCENCQTEMENSEGCVSCANCGTSYCSV